MPCCLRGDDGHVTDKLWRGYGMGGYHEIVEVAITNTEDIRRNGEGGEAAAESGLKRAGSGGRIHPAAGATQQRRVGAERHVT